MPLEVRSEREEHLSPSTSPLHDTTWRGAQPDSAGSPDDEASGHLVNAGDAEPMARNRGFRSSSNDEEEEHAENVVPYRVVNSRVTPLLTLMRDLAVSPTQAEGHARQEDTRRTAGETSQENRNDDDERSRRSPISTASSPVLYPSRPCLYLGTAPR